ncbi:hypothetical protein CSQ87_06055 [Bifidobacterium simiarum]|uniref:Uncharacterized protein n=1 Tax=Bifidobacterium simiarum TaxID=2045441 RepID=A0A2M9HEC5_9BIFI|nr:hypothetical protein CSQ87_06055 [Bifidobacterium simiarum]
MCAREVIAVLAITAPAIADREPGDDGGMVGRIIEDSMIGFMKGRTTTGTACFRAPFFRIWRNLCR